MLVHFATRSLRSSADVREAIDDIDAFKAVQDDAHKGGQWFGAHFEPKSPSQIVSTVSVGLRTGQLHFFGPATGKALC